MIAMQNSKDSGLDWFGFIPEHWQILPMKLLLEKIYSGGTPTTTMSEFWTDNEDGINWVAISDITKSKGILTETAKKITQKGLESKNLEIIPKGTLLLSIFASLGKTTTLGIDSTVNQAIIGLQPNSKLNQKFLQYLFEDCERYINYYSSANTQENLNVSKIKDLVFPVPPLSEQVKIAAFLDQKTAQIDAIIEKKQKLLQLLDEKKKSVINEAVTGQKVWNGNAWRKPSEVKDSGIEWIGVIPKDWSVKKIKYLSKVISKGTTPSTEGKALVDEGIRYLKSENIINNNVSRFPEFFIDEETNQLLRRSILEENDLLFVIAGASIGKTALLPKEFLPANTNQAVCFIRFKKNVNFKFLHFVTMSNGFQNMMWLNAVTSAQPNLSMTSIGDFSVPIPSQKIQEKIVDFIETKIEDINLLTTKLIVQINKLQEYRQSIISEAVTGKLKI